jgi:hypothetical protein
MKGYFSLVQFCPDIGRAEAANIGVLLFAPETRFLRVILCESNSHVRRFFGRTAPGEQHLEAMKRAFAAGLQSTGKDFRDVEDLRAFSQSLANNIILTSPRWVKILGGPEHTLTVLFTELVLDPESVEAATTS